MHDRHDGEDVRVLGRKLILPSSYVGSSCKKAKLQAGIKPTALCLVIDKKNSIKFPLDFLHYLYNYYMVCVLSSHAYHVTSCDCDMTLSHTPFCVVSPRKRKEKKYK